MNIKHDIFILSTSGRQSGEEMTLHDIDVPGISILHHGCDDILNLPCVSPSLHMMILIYRQVSTVEAASHAMRCSKIGSLR
jgi:hypothetical protein